MQKRRQVLTLTSSGKFTISLAWEALRDKRASLGSRKLIWDHRVPCKISIFMWKMLNKYLPFPEVLNKFGFQLPLKSQFCQIEETQNCSLSDCPFAMTVWDLYSRVLQLRVSSSSSMLYRLQHWWYYRSFHSARGELLTVLPSIISWELWKARNHSFYEGGYINSMQVCRNVQMSILSISQAIPFVQVTRED